MADNQTNRRWLQIPRVADNPNAKGTGVFKKSASSSKEFINNVEYETLVSTAENENWDSYSWVPHEIATQDQVHGASCGGRCVPASCPPGCICGRTTGLCE